MNILIAIVHNNDCLRVAGLKESARELVSYLNSVGVGSVVREYSFQPKITGHSYITYLRRAFMYEILNYRWVKYREIPYTMKSFFYSVRTIFFKTFLTFRNSRRLRFSEIETFVSDKHLRAWFNCLEGFDAVLVFEDDAVFNKGSIEDFLSFVKKIDIGVGGYYDLAGGLDRESLLISRLIDFNGSLDKFVCYKKIVTNTACSYFITKPLLEMFCSLVISNPSSRLIGIDWLINSLSMSLEGNETQELKCFHSEPPIFQHGSFTGKYESWQK